MSLFAAACNGASLHMRVQAKESALAEKPKDAFEESDDESAISRTESELREVTKVKTSCCYFLTVLSMIVSRKSTGPTDRMQHVLA